MSSKMALQRKGWIALLTLFSAVAYTQSPYQDTHLKPTEQAAVKPYRTFLTVQRFTVENNGEPENPISNVRLEMSFRKDTEKEVSLKLPGGDQYWPIGNGQVQEIDQTFEIPWEFIQKDGFAFEMQIYRKGTRFLPCKFDVAQLSQFNRSYTCKSDISWQRNEKVPEDRLDVEAVQIRIFTDLNSPRKDVPKDAIALK